MGVQENLNTLYAKYDDPVTCEVTGDIRCPVCSKPYKTQNAAENHRDKRDCIDLKNACHGEQIEYDAMKLYGIVTTILGKNSHLAIRAFRKNKSYNSVLKLVFLLKKKKMFNNAEMYLSWCVQFYQKKEVHQVLFKASQETTFHDFSLHIQHYPEYITDDYLDLNLTEFIEEPKFLLSRCKTGFVPLMSILTKDKYKPLREAINKQPLIANLLTDYYNAIQEAVL